MTWGIIIITIILLLILAFSYFILKQKKSLKTLIEEKNNAEILRRSLSKENNSLEKKKSNFHIKLQSILSEISQLQEKYSNLDNNILSTLKKFNLVKTENESLERFNQRLRLEAEKLDKTSKELKYKISVDAISISHLTEQHLALLKKIANAKAETQVYKRDFFALKNETEILATLKLKLEKENSQLLFEIANKKNYLDK